MGDNGTELLNNTTGAAGDEFHLREMSVHETVKTMIDILQGEEFEIEGELLPDTLIEEIGLDSLDIINFLFILGEKIGVEVPDDVLLSEEIKILSDLASYVDQNRP